MRRYNIGLIVSLIVIFWSAISYAITVSIDQFSITRDGNPFFTDTFNAAVGPPTGPTNIPPNYNPAIYGASNDAPLAYFVLDNTTVGTTTSGTTLTAAESGGLLQLNSANGAFSANAIETPRLTLAVQVLTSITGGTSQLGKTNVLSETGLFNLTIPTGPMFSAYGIRFTDNLAARNGSGQLLQLFVRFNPNTNQAEVAYILQDFGANTITIIGTTALLPPSGADQIELFLSEDTVGGAFSGSFEYPQRWSSRWQPGHIGFRVAL